ncbi:MAG: tRNA epoxyqueuosine(34) reductase QueG [Planctomycetota bacterium]
MAGGPEAIEIAREVGFDLAGIAPLAPPRAAERFARWLAAGHQAAMAWLERARETIRDPRRLHPGGRSILVVGLSHRRPAAALASGGKIARYALGADYHGVLGLLLARLAERLRRAGVGGRLLSFVDAAPLLERSHAAEAGLGFESRSANLLHPRLGPWFFLGEIVLEEELEPTPAPRLPSCGTCTACLEACPTGALVEPGILDARLCLSYHTIEHRGPIPRALRPRLAGWLFGCDVCSEVCPFGRRAADASARYGTHPALEAVDLPGLVRMPQAAVEASFAGSALRRPGRVGLARNAALLLGLLPREEGRAALEEALERDASPVVREAAAWAILAGHGADAGVREAVERARRREPVPWAERSMGGDPAENLPAPASRNPNAGAARSDS